MISVLKYNYSNSKYANPILLVYTQLDEYSPTFNLEYEPRDYCSDTTKKYSNPHTINTSWATGTIAAAEYLIQETLSLDYILECLPK